MDFQIKPRYTFEDLVSVMSLLRAPGGCPWDREQTHESIRSNFIEETYEAVEAIDTNDSELLKEELGDVLLQVVFHAQMEREKGVFSIDDVTDGIVKKLIVRHPHVFGETIVSTSTEVLRNWDEIKKQTKRQTTQSEVLQSVSKALPALMRSAKVQHKAAKVGFDWPDVSGALSKISEELGELHEAVKAGTPDEREEELGDLLFSVVNVSRFLKVEPEEALTRSCDKFIERFSKVEKMAGQRGIDMKSSSLEELDRLWDEAKRTDGSQA